MNSDIINSFLLNINILFYRKLPPEQYYIAPVFLSLEWNQHQIYAQHDPEQSMEIETISAQYKGVSVSLNLSKSMVVKHIKKLKKKKKKGWKWSQSMVVILEIRSISHIQHFEALLLMSDLLFFDKIRFVDTERGKYQKWESEILPKEWKKRKRKKEKQWAPINRSKMKIAKEKLNYHE